MGERARPRHLLARGRWWFGGTPSTIAPLLWSCGLVAGLAPYALADYLLGLARRRLGYRDAAT
jgi:hypothetical protein